MRFSDLVKELKEIYCDLVFCFREYNEDLNKYDYVEFSFGYGLDEDYTFTIDFKENKINLLTEFLESDLPLDEIKDIGKVASLLEKYFDVIKETFRG